MKKRKKYKLLGVFLAISMLMNIRIHIQLLSLSYAITITLPFTAHKFHRVYLSNAISIWQRNFLYKHFILTVIQTDGTILLCKKCKGKHHTICRLFCSISFKITDSNLHMPLLMSVLNY